MSSDPETSGSFGGWTKRRASLLAASVAATILCSGLAYWAGARQPKTISAEVYALQAIPVINERMTEAQDGYVFIAGDSHAELVNPTYRLCGREIFNGGVSGAWSALYSDLLKKIEFKTLPSIAVLTIGPNDILRKKDPLSPRKTAEYERNVVEILNTLRTKTKRIYVTALPPVSQELAGKVEIEAVGAYSEQLRKLCEREGCTFVDPFLDMREEDGSTARPGAMRNGWHLKSYRRAYTNLARRICPSGAL